MTLEIIIKYLHFLSIFTIVAALSGEHLLLKDQLSRKEIRRISILDTIYGISALTLLLAGLSLWLWVGKPAEFYSKNWIFHLKLTLFIIIGLLSIYPTIFFLKQRKGDEEEKVDVPKRVKMMIRLELLLLFIIPLLASLMAKGIGYFGN
jgi:putative membrane protein